MSLEDSSGLRSFVPDRGSSVRTRNPSERRGGLGGSLVTGPSPRLSAGILVSVVPKCCRGSCRGVGGREPTVVRSVPYEVAEGGVGPAYGVTRATPVGRPEVGSPRHLTVVIGVSVPDDRMSVPLLPSFTERVPVDQPSSVSTPASLSGPVHPLCLARTSGKDTHSRVVRGLQEPLTLDSSGSPSATLNDTGPTPGRPHPSGQGPLPPTRTRSRSLPRGVHKLPKSPGTVQGPGLNLEVRRLHGDGGGESG